MALLKKTGGLTLSVFDGGQLLVHGLVCGFGEGFSCGTIAVMHQVRGHHPDETTLVIKNSSNSRSWKIMSENVSSVSIFWPGNSSFHRKSTWSVIVFINILRKVAIRDQSSQHFCPIITSPCSRSGPMCILSQEVLLSQLQQNKSSHTSLKVHN